MDNVNILYEDSHMTVCEKPPLVLSQKDAKGSAPDLASILTEQTGIEHRPVHRLDMGVGGAMVYARTQKSAAVLSSMIQDNRLTKEYLAVVCGVPAETEGIYKDLLFKDSSKNKSYVVDRQRKGVKEASLEYKVLETAETEKGTLTLVRIKLHTGRTHQIRVQFASRRTPLYGDGKYGSRTNEKNVALWSYRLSFPHPIGKKEMFFSSDPPAYFPWNAFDYEEILNKDKK